MQIRIIGCGAMGSAIAQILHESGKEISLFDKHEERAESLAHALGASKSSLPLENLSNGDAIILAVKPQDFDTVTAELKPFEAGLVVSLLTGFSIQKLKKAFPNCTVLRMMPNLAIRYGDGIVAL